MSNTKNPSSSNVITDNLRKNFLWNTVGSTASALVSLFLMMTVTRINSIDNAGIFSFAFSMAATFLVIGVYSGRTFQVTDKNQKTTDSDYFYLKFATGFAMLIVSIVFCCLRGYSADKFLIIILLTMSRVFEALAECIYAVIQKKNRLYQVGQSMLIKAVVSLLVFAIIDYLTRNLILSCASIILVYALVITFFDLPRLVKTDFHLQKLQPAKVLYLLKIGFFTFGFTLLNFYLINASRYAIDLTSSDAAQTIYGIIAMPATVLALVGQYLIQPFLTSLKKLFATSVTAFRSLIVKLCLAVFGIGALCLLAAWLLGIPVLELLYAITLEGNLPGLLFILVGGTFNAVAFVISTGLITMRHTSDQFWIYCLVSAATLFFSHCLVSANGILGACFSYMLSMILLFLLYLGVFVYRMYRFKQNPAQAISRAAKE